MNLSHIKLIVLDVDGTMTDGGIYIDDNGIESKKFNVKDGLGIKLAQDAGIEFLILTGRESGCVEKRAWELKIKHIAQNISNKRDYLEKFAVVNNFSPENIAYIGDDLNDLPVMSYAGVSACPVDAAEKVKQCCDYVLPKMGGDGVVRSFVEIILENRNL
jgi:3-deoxy-D-manno-octulosonate 8-phosphate phosphatase (KDO 8-P phosphatase)